ncbi:hypothetical protein [Thiolinea disciformis]|uniref:hypothetical protein n=1 Tax=Thiolinea disciformis TaxID=125614 RepID=UPI000364F5F5|nr:hypothetical protein [Thiolinea disciformis]
MRNLAKALIVSAIAAVAMSACTQETQNKLGRAINNWTGTNGVLEIYAGDKVARRFIRIDKLTTAEGTSSSDARPYRYGYGYLDSNLNGIVDKTESYVYFEVSDYSTPYVFFEEPKGGAVAAQ